MEIEFVVWHVGGGGDDFGPIEKILQLDGVSFQVYLFELRDPEDSKIESIPQLSANPNIKLSIIPIGLAGKSEVRDFYINKFELSSSLLQPSSLTKTDNPGFSRWGSDYKNMLTWAQNTELKQVKKVKTISVDEIVDSLVAPSPEILSMDIQGAEVEVLQGSEKAFQESILAVTTESEFFEIYAKQGLFYEQLQILEKKSFRFVKFFNFQKWYPGPLIGRGFTTVTESLFIKYLVHPNQLTNSGVKFHDFSSYTSMQIFKTALISFAYGRYSYFYTCINYLDVNDKTFLDSVKFNSRLKRYYNFYVNINIKINKLEENPHYFLENPIEVSGKIKMQLNKKFYSITDKLIKILRLRGLIFKTDRHFSRFGEMD